MAENRMTCGECVNARAISANIVNCRKFGINIRYDYSGCISRFKKRRNEDGKNRSGESHDRL